MPTDLGKSLAKVAKVAVINMAAPIPSSVRIMIHVRIKPQVEGILTASLK